MYNSKTQCRYTLLSALMEYLLSNETTWSEQTVHAYVCMLNMLTWCACMRTCVCVHQLTYSGQKMLRAGDLTPL